MRELARRLGALSGWRRLAAAAGLGALAALALPPIYAVPFRQPNLGMITVFHSFPTLIIAK